MKWVSGYLVFTRDDTKHPCTRLTCIRGFAVGRIERYRCVCPLAVETNSHFCPSSSFGLLTGIFRIVEHERLPRDAQHGLSQ